MTETTTIGVGEAIFSSFSEFEFCCVFTIKIRNSNLTQHAAHICDASPIVLLLPEKHRLVTMYFMYSYIYEYNSRDYFIDSWSECGLLFTSLNFLVDGLKIV